MTKLGSDVFSESTDVDSLLANIDPRVTANENDIIILEALQDRLNPATLAIMIADSSIEDDDILNAQERTAGGGGGATWKAVLESTVTTNGTFIVAGTGTQSPALAFVLQDTDGNVLKYGATNNGPDSSAACNAALTHVNKLTNPDGATIFAIEIELLDSSFVQVPAGTFKLVANSIEWSRVFTNKDRVNGNENFVVDFTGGIGDGNRDNQGDVNQHFFLFINCRNCTWIGGKLGKNRALKDDTTEITPLIDHPDAPFNQGVPFGEPPTTNPESGFGYFLGGSNNWILNATLIDWMKEGLSMRWVANPVIHNITGISGPETTNEYYDTVDFSSRSGLQTVVEDDQVVVLSDHFFGGVRQQPQLIYKATSAAAGSIDLGLEDYEDVGAGRWVLVTRDTSLDYGYTVARMGGAGKKQGIMSDCYGAFCRASTFSLDMEDSVVSDMTSYHNSFQVGMNLGHANTPASGSTLTNITCINSGWQGGVGGNSFGINVVGETKDVSIDNYYVVGPGRNCINVSDNGDRVKLGRGLIEFSPAGGLKASSATVDCEGLTSRSNVGDDFEPSGSGVISLNNCRDSRDILLNNERIIVTARTGQVQQTIYGDSGKHRKLFRDSFAVSSGVALVSLVGTNTSSDNMIIDVTYSERNSGSSSAANQRACKTTFLVSGSDTARTVQILNESYQLNRKLRATWTVGTETFEVFLTDLAPVDVTANNSNNSLYVEIQNNGFNYSGGLG